MRIKIIIEGFPGSGRGLISKELRKYLKCKGFDVRDYLCHEYNLSATKDKYDTKPKTQKKSSTKV